MGEFTLTSGVDNFTGDAAGNNFFFFTPATLQGTDTITGGSGPTFSDRMILTAGGTVTASQFAGVTNIEILALSSVGNNVTLTNGLVAGTSTGQFVVFGSGNNDAVDASGTTNGTRIVFLGGGVGGDGGADSVIGGNGNDYFEFGFTNLTSADTVTGGSGFDVLALGGGPGTVAASAFTNVTGIEELLLGSGVNVTLTNGLVGTSGPFVVYDGSGNETIDASGVSNGTRVVFFASAGADTLRGGNGSDFFQFNAADLTSADTVNGGAGFDILAIGNGGTVAASAFTNVTSIEELLLSNGGNSVTLTNSLVGTNPFVVYDGTGADTIDASGVTNGNRVVFFAGVGNDTLLGGNGSDVFAINTADLTSGDTITGGGGLDILLLNTGGTVAASALANVTGLEELVLSNAGNNVSLTNNVVGTPGPFVVYDGTGNDVVDASLVTNGTRVVFNIGSGTDSMTGGSGNDFFAISTADLTAADTIHGGAGSDFLQFATTGVVTAASLAGVAGIESLGLVAGNAVTLANTLTSAGSLDVYGTSGAETVDGSLVSAYDIVFHSSGGADVLKGGSGNDAFLIQDSAFAQIDGGSGVNDRIVLSGVGQTLNVSANAAKISNIDVLWLDLSPSNNEIVTLTAADITAISGASNTLYVVGSSDDQVSAGAGWTLMNTGVTNATLAPGYTFNEYLNSNGATLFIADQIAASITTSSNNPPDIELGGFPPDGINPPDGPDWAASYTTGDTNGVAIADVDARYMDADPVGVNSRPDHLTVTLTNPHSNDATTREYFFVTAAGHTLAAANGITITGENTTTLTLTAAHNNSAHPNAADFQDLLRDIRYVDTDVRPGQDYSDRIIHVDAQDQGNGSNTAAQRTTTIDLTKGNIPPDAPTDNDGAANSVLENSPAGSTVGVTAHATDPDGDPVTYSLTDNAGGRFTIDSGTGVVKTTGSLDFETDPHSYSITVQAADNHGGTSSASFSINLADANDNAPVFTSSATPSVAENTTAVVALTTTDADTVGTNPPTFTITGGADQGLFTITGGNQLAFTAARDFETQAHSYAVQVTANDGTNNTVQNLTVTLTDTNDNAPVFTSSATPSVAENTTAVVDLTTTDADTVGTNPPTFTITGGADSGLFTITGGNHLAFASARDYETQAHSYAVQVTANDGTNNTPQNITVTLTDTNDNSPIFQSGTTGSEFENSPTSTVAYDADATDADLTPAFNTITYSLSAGGDNDFFNINSSNGQVTFKVSPDFENPQDTGGDNGYDIVVHASDGTHDTTQNVTITVNDVNEPPTLTATGNNPVYAPGVDLFSSVSASTIETGQFIDQLVFTVSNVNDTDETMSIDGTSVALTDGNLVTPTAGNGMDVSVAVVGTTATVTVSKAGGVAASTIASIVDGLTYTDAAPPTGSRDITITSLHDTGGNANGGNPTGTPNITSTVLFNQPPVIDAPANADTFATSINENTTAVTTVHATDPDNSPVTPVTYSIVNGFEDGALFQIGSTSGVLSFITAPNFENPQDTVTDGTNTYIVQVQASDGASTDTQTITVTVNDVNEAPTANPDTASVTEAGGVANGTAGVDITSGFNVITGAGTGSVADTDPDAGQTLTVVGAAAGTQAGPLSGNVNTGLSTANNYGTFTIQPGGDYTYTVNQTNAAVQGLRQFTDTLTDTFSYTIQDDGAGNLKSTTTVTVTIHGQNDNPVANADSVTVAEKGGVNNATGGTDITGFTFNAITGAGTGNVADTDVDAGETLKVIGVLDGNHLADPNSVIGNIGAGVSDNNNYGTLTFQNTGGGQGDGSYNFVVNQANTNFLLATEHLDLVYTYKIQDLAGATSVALLNVRINGADDLAQATADTGSMTEDDSATIFPVENNDVTDPDHDALNTISLGAVTVSSAAAGTSFANSDATVTLANSSTAVQVALGAAFQQLHAGETATVTVPYTLTGSPGQTSTVNLVVTVSGANDVPLASDDNFTITEDQSGLFDVRLNDTVDPDHGAPNNVTTGAVTNLVAPAGENIDVTDITVGVDANQKITVSLGADFQHMKDGETTTFDIPYTLHGDQAGDTSSATVHVTVTGANDNPTAQNFTFNGASSAIGNTSLVLDDGVGAAAPDPAGPQKTITGSLLTGAVDPDGPQPLAVVAQNNVATTHGHVTVTTTGEFSYAPNPGFIGSDTFNYTVTDGNTPTAGTDTKSVTINVATPHVWYVNADAVSDGDGTSDNPFNTLSHFAGAGGVDSAGDIIFVYNATNHLTGGLTLESNEQLIGQDVGLTVNGTTLEAATGVNGAIIDGGVVLGIDNTISGVTLGNTGAGGTALSGVSFGTLNVDHTVVNTNNNGMILSTGAFGAGATFTSFTSAGATDVSLTSVTGSVDLGTGTMSGLFAVNGGTVSTTYGGNLSQANNAAMVSVSGGHQTGTLTFNGTLTATNGTGLQFDNADGTYNFNGTNTLSNTVGGVNANAGIDIVNGSNGTFSFSANSSIKGQTSTGETAFNVSGAGTGNITYAGTIGATDATDNAGTSVSIVGHTGGTVALTGSILDSTDSGGGIGVSGNANTTINFSGAAKTLNTGIGDGVSITNNTGTSNVNFTNGGLTVQTSNGTAFQDTVAGTVTVTGSGNTLATSGTGAIVNMSDVALGAGGVTFGSLQSTGTVNTTAVLLNNVDGGNAFTSGGTSIAATSGASSDGIRVSGGSATTFNFNGTTTVSNTGNDGIALSGANGAVTFNSVALNGMTGDGIDISGNTNSVTVSGGTIGNSNDPAGMGVNVNTSGTGDVSVAASITKTTAGNVVNVSGHTGGTVAFSGAVSGTGAVADGVNLSSNTGATINFSGGMTLTTGANAGFNATGGGTVNVTGTNHITTTSGTALNINGTTIGGSNVTFQDISQNGGTNGIVLNTTGTSGHLAVTGTGSAGTGGTIQNTTGDGISLTSAQDTQLSWMNVNNNGGQGLSGNTLNGLVLNHLSMTGNGNSFAGNGEGNIFLNELTGTTSGGLHPTTISNSTLSNAFVNNIFVQNTGGTLSDLVVSGNTISNNGASTHGTDGFQINLAAGGVSGSPTATVHFLNNTQSGHINFADPTTFTATGFAGAVDDGTLNVHIGDGTLANDNSFSSNNSGITLSATNSGNLNFDINNNTTTLNRAVGITVNHFNTGTVTGFIQNTTIGTQGVTNSGAKIGNGLEIHDESAGTTTVSITNNIIQSVGDGAGSGFEGVDIQKGTSVNTGAGTLNVTFTGNTIRDILDDRGLFVNEIDTGGTGQINALISGNTFSNANAGGASTTARVGGAPGGTEPVNVTQANANALAAANGLTASNLAGNTMRVDTNVVFNQPAPPTPPATPQLAAQGQGPGSEDVLTMDQLAPVVAAAIAHWQAAGASAEQLDLLYNAHVHIADLPDSGYLGNTVFNDIAIDTNGAGWGWFVDTTPWEDTEFGTAISDTSAVATSGDAAGHIDLLTVVEHEMGHILGLSDSTQDGIMNVALDAGTRILPTEADVAVAQQAEADTAAAAQAASAAAAQPAEAAAPAPSVPDTSGNDTLHSGAGSVVLTGGLGADTFVVDQLPAAAPAHIADYSALQNDIIDVSAIVTLPPVMRGQAAPTDADLVRVAEDASGAFATLEVSGAGHWTAVAQLDGVHAGDAVDVVLDGTHTPHQLHAAWLA